MQNRDAVGFNNEDKPKTMRKQPNRMQQFWDSLPKQFDRKTGEAAAVQLEIPDSTARRYINDFITAGQLQRIGHGHYKKG